MAVEAQQGFDIIRHTSHDCYIIIDLLRRHVDEGGFQDHRCTEGVGNFIWVKIIGVRVGVGISGWVNNNPHQ